MFECSSEPRQFPVRKMPNYPDRLEYQKKTSTGALECTVCMCGLSYTLFIDIGSIIAKQLIFINYFVLCLV